MSKVKQVFGFTAEMFYILLLTAIKAVARFLTYVSGVVAIVFVTLMGLAILINSPYSNMFLSASLKLMIIAAIASIVCHDYR